MKYTNSIKAALAAAALTFGVAGAQAQYSIVPPVASGSATVLPYGGYYGPAISPTPTITFGAPYFYDPFSFGFGDFGYGYGFYGPGVFNSIGDVNNASGGPSQGRTVNGTVVQGGLVDPTAAGAIPPGEEIVPPAAGDIQNNNAANSDQQARLRAYRAAVANLVTVRRAPYNRLAISYNGNINGVSSVTMMLLDSRGREVQQDVLTSAPARTLLRRPVNTRYVRVILEYNDGTHRTITRPISNN
jgi:hypothetical protein